MLARRIRRDVSERGRSVEGVLEQYVCPVPCIYPPLITTTRYLRFVKPAFDNFVGPSSRYADIVSYCETCFEKTHKDVASQIVPGADNGVAIDLITTHIHKKLQDRARQIRPKIARGLSGYQTGVHTPGTTLDLLNLTAIKKTPQLDVCCNPDREPSLKSVVGYLYDSSR